MTKRKYAIVTNSISAYVYITLGLYCICIEAAMVFGVLAAIVAVCIVIENYL